MRMRPRALARASLLPLLLAAAACTPDREGLEPDAGVDGGAPDAGAPPDAGPLSCAPAELPPLEEGGWDPHFTIAGLSGHDGLVPALYDFATDADGSLLAAGRFEYLGRERVAPLVRLKDGAWTQAREALGLPLPLSGFSAVAVGPAGELALSTGDSFGERTGEVWLDSGSGLSVIGHFEGLVRTLLWVDGQLWVAGDFTLTEAPAAPGLAVWNGTKWTAPPGGSADGPVFELLREGDSVWVGGGFDNVGGIAARRVAEWNGTSWQAHDMTFAAAAAVYALARGADGAMYAGGVLVEDPDTRLGGIARLEGTTWTFLGNGVSNGFFPGVVSDLLLDDGKLYVTGCFRTVNGTDEDVTAVHTRSFARWTGSAWEALNGGAGGVGSSWFSPISCGDEGPAALWDMEFQRMVKSGEHIYLAGAFAGVGEVASQSLIAFDGERFLPQGAPERGAAGAFTDFAVGGPDCVLYGLGGVTHVGTQPVPGGVVQYRDGWSALGSGLPEGYECSEIEVDGAGDVYLGCTDFDTFAGRVFRLEEGTWAPVGEAFANSLVMDLARDPTGTLWVAGGAETGFVARLDGEDFTVVEDAFDGLVSHLAFKPRTDATASLEYVAAGTFLQLGTEPFAHIAHWDGAAWQPLGAGLSSTPSALEFGLHGIYAATQDEGGPDRLTLGRWDGDAWEELATPAHGLPAPMGESVHTFLQLREVGGSLVASGYVWPQSGGRNVFVFDGDAFTAIGGGVNAIDVGALAVTREGLWFGGTIADTGSGTERRPSVGVAHYAFGTAP